MSEEVVHHHYHHRWDCNCYRCRPNSGVDPQADTPENRARWKKKHKKDRKNFISFTVLTMLFFIAGAIALQYSDDISIAILFIGIVFAGICILGTITLIFSKESPHDDDRKIEIILGVSWYFVFPPFLYGIVLYLLEKGF